MNEEITRIYQAINAVSMRVNDVNSRLDSYINNRVDEITPYTATQTAYYGESEKVFYNVPQGNITVFWDNYAGDYSVQRFDGGVNVSFETLTVAEATISIMVQ